MTSATVVRTPPETAAPPLDNLEALLADAQRHSDRGDAREGLTLADRALTLARERGDRVLVARALAAVAVAARVLVDYPRVLAACDEALELAAPDAADVRVECALCRGHVFLELGDFRRALDSAAQARGFLEHGAATLLAVRCLQFEAMIQARLQDFEAAETAYRTALELALQGGDAHAIALLHNSLGVFHLRRAQPEPGEQADSTAHLNEALAHFEASRPYADRAGDARLLMLLDGNIAGTLGELGRLTEARDAFARQLHAARAQHDRHDEALILVNLGEAHRRLGDHAAALPVLHEALVLAQRSGIKARERRAHRELAAAYEAAGDAAQALAHFKAFHALDRDAYASPARGALRAQVLQDEIQRVQREADRLRREQERLARANARLAEEAHHDPLTGLANRRLLDEALREAAAQSASFAVALFDVDHFKSINDRYTHVTGDSVLRVFADILRDACRSSDLPARVGGEEFMLLLRAASLGDAYAAAERVRAAVECYRWDTLAPGLTVTVSAGVASDASQCPEMLSRSADEALYRAKRGGRNRVLPARDGA